MDNFYNNDFFKSAFFKADTFKGTAQGKHFNKKPTAKKKPATTNKTKKKK